MTVGFEGGVELRHPVLTRAAAVLTSVLLVIGLAACTDSRLAEGTSVTVALPEAFTSYNPNTGHGSASDTNASIVEATNSRFASWNAEGELVFDESFGSVEKLSDDPLTVRYTVADGVEWSDGVPVDAADLLLAWAANSRTLNDEEFEAGGYIDPETGLFTDDFPSDVVYFDGFTAGGLDAVTRSPEVSADGRGVTLVFDEYVADWASVFTVGLPAHVVAARALDLPEGSDASEAKATVIEAIDTSDEGVLAPLSRTWNSGFVVEGGEVDAELLVGTGPYTVTALGEEGVTLTANPRYRGDHRPRFETIEVRHIADPLQVVAALERGEVDVAAPRVTSDVLAGLDDSKAGDVEIGIDGVWELLQPRFEEAMSPAIEDERVREAFLRSIPRDALVEAAGVRGADAAARESFTMAPGVTGYEQSLESTEGVRFERDAVAARELLAEAAEDDPSLADPTVCILFDPANPRRVAQFSAIRDAAASVGITVTDCSSPDWRNLLGTPRSWDAALYGLRERNLSVQAATAMFQSGSPLNHGGFADDDVDELLAELERERDTEARATLRAELDGLLWKAGWGLPLLQLPAVTVVAEEVAGVTHSPYAASVLHEPWRWRPAEGDTGS
ncbi:ABC transporter substrate-binding protein [Salinibacterium sp. SYSU T00001]|uniref:ABC transporter substrate-binding protein n=1 Tax=Homoserinimonas sedimenticola TaxID=2986805 RepID=UPI002236037A|nr:ABC transporter substrate-binding protein [Salinibacterium sedimenticola]MCW4386496.1 ABC transporter substrate-binding protein [Salinibacterium sedimenticola]